MINKYPIKKEYIFVITLICIFVTISNVCTAIDPDPDEQRPVFQPGDIILVHYPARDGYPLNTFYWSHASLYLGSELVIHSYGVPNGVEIVTIDEEIFNHLDGLIDNWALLRVKGNPDVDAVISYAQSKLGQPYDQWSIDNFTKQLQAPPCHPGYGYYCAELVWSSYKSTTGINFDINRIGLINLWEIFTNDHVSNVYTRIDPPNPMMPAGDLDVVEGQTCIYTTLSDADEIYFQWNWDEEPFNPGPWTLFSHDGSCFPLVPKLHTWQKIGTHNVRVRCTDDKFNESHYSNWSSPLVVTVNSDKILEDLSKCHMTNIEQNMSSIKL